MERGTGSPPPEPLMDAPKQPWESAQPWTKKPGPLTGRTFKDAASHVGPLHALGPARRTSRPQPGDCSRGSNSLSNGKEFAKE